MSSEIIMSNIIICVFECLNLISKNERNDLAKQVMTNLNVPLSNANE